MAIEYNRHIIYNGRVMGEVRALRIEPNEHKMDFSFESYATFRLMVADSKPNEKITFEDEIRTVDQLRNKVLPAARQITIKSPR